MSSLWNIVLEGAQHVVELVFEGPGVSSMVISDGVEHRFPRKRGADRVVTFDIAGHPATLTRTAVRPGFWARFRRGFGGALLGGADGAAASLLVSWGHELVIDGTSHGTWVATTAGGDVKSWVFVGPGKPVPLPSPPTAGARRAVPHDVTMLDDAQLALRLRDLADSPADEGNPFVELRPAGIRAMSLSIDREGFGAGDRVLVARFAHGGGGRRQSLLTAGWQMEPNYQGTRYFVRRFPTQPGDTLDSVVAALRAAYAVVYGPKVGFGAWTGDFSVHRQRIDVGPHRGREGSPIPSD
jgi:hypothetical protein